MNTLSRAARLISAAAAAAVTLTLLTGVLAMAEPKRSVLLARTNPIEQPMKSEFRLAADTAESARAIK